MGKNSGAFIKGLSLLNGFRFYLVKILETVIYHVTKGSFAAGSRFFQAVEEKGCRLEFNDGFFKVEFQGYSYIMRSGTSDCSVFAEVVLKGEYDLLVGLTKRNNIHVRSVLDAGANCGFTSIHLSGKFPEANFICIEPDVDNFSMLSRNIELNRLSRLKGLKAALSSTDGWMEQVYAEDQEHWGRKFMTKDGAGSVEAFTVERIMQEQGLHEIDVMKIDIEGGEVSLFTDVGPSFLARTKLVVVEVHEIAFREVLHGVLKNYGFFSFDQGSLVYGVRGDLIQKQFEDRSAEISSQHS